MQLGVEREHEQDGEPMVQATAPADGQPRPGVSVPLLLLGMLMPLAVVGLIVFGVTYAGKISLPDIGGSSEATTSGDESSNQQPPPPTKWAVGACVKSVGASVYPVSCSGPSNGSVIARKSSPDDCPSNVSTYVRQADGVYCVKLN